MKLKNELNMYLCVYVYEYVYVNDLKKETDELLASTATFIDMRTCFN